MAKLMNGRGAARRGFLVLRAAEPVLSAGALRIRRAVLASRLQVAARWRDAEVVIDIAPDAWIGAVEIDVWHSTRTVVRIGAGARVADGVRLSLRGGVLDIGARADVRRLGTYHVGGTLEIGADAMLSTGVHVHCADAVSIGNGTLLAEYTSVVDSWHRRTPQGVPIQHAVGTSPTRIGDNVWVGARATIGPGLSVGDQCIVGSGAVVTRDVPPGWLAVGVPARAVRKLDIEVEPGR